MSKLIELNDRKSFDSAIKNELPVIVDFWAPWCGPCRPIMAMMEELSVQYQDKVVFAKNNIDLNLFSANQYNVMSIPTLIAFRDGVEVHRMTGAHAMPRIKTMIDMVLSGLQP